MRKLVALLATATLFCSAAHGQGFGGMFPGPGAPHSTGAAFAGPGDVLAVGGAGMAYSCSRAYSAATKGTKNCNVCNPSDVVCADISSDATTGIVAVPIIGGVNCGSSTCTIKTAYDLSGNGHDVTNATIANRPTLASVTAGSAVVAMKCVGSSSQILSGAITTASSYPSSASAVMERTGAFTSFGFAFAARSGGFRVGWNASTNTSFIDAGTAINATMSDSALHSVEFVAGSSTANAWIDGTPTSSGTGGQYPVGTMSLCTDQSGNYMTGYLWEALVFTNIDLTSNVSAMNSNQTTFY